MIKFEGWTFDFKNMKAVDYEGRRFHLMKLNNQFYVKHDVNVNMGEESSYRSSSWHFIEYRMPNKKDIFVEIPCKIRDKQLTELYMTWCVEEAIFGPTDGR